MAAALFVGRISRRPDQPSDEPEEGERCFVIAV